MERVENIKSPWIHSKVVDSSFIILPMLLPAMAVILFPSFFEKNSSLSPLLWFFLIVGVDVSHVYSTLYRTYFDPQEFSRYRILLIAIPLFGWMTGALLYSIDSMIFWRCLAYLAVFHFVRQQYGFFSIYARNENRPNWERKLDGITIYSTTLFPILWWHCHQPREFHWFVDGDFFVLNSNGLANVAAVVYAFILLSYFFKEIIQSLRTKYNNLPKNLVVAGTAVSWFTGIVLYNGDLAFTATNVISHGIPYMALIWFYGNRKNNLPASSEQRPGWLRNIFKWQYIPVFAGLLFLFAFLEEAIWDSAVWRDHASIFGSIYTLPQLHAGDTLALLIPLLAVPQITHYVIDGFIWKVRKEDSELREVVLRGD